MSHQPVVRVREPIGRFSSGSVAIRPRSHRWIVPRKPPTAEGVIVVYDLAATDVQDHRFDRARSGRRSGPPHAFVNAREVRDERLALVRFLDALAPECFIEQV
jgi:hypothetical protein